MKAKEIIPEVRRRPDIENIPYGFGSGAPVGGGIPAGRIEPTLGQIGSQAAQSAARIKSVSPNQPLNAPGQNVWRSGQTGAPMRSPGDKAQNIDDVVLRQTHQAARRGTQGGPIPVPGSTTGEKIAAVAGATGAVGGTGALLTAPLGTKPTSGQSTPQASARDPNMTQQTQDRLGISLDSQGRTASGATSAPAAKPAGPQQGVVGSELGRLSGGEFASRADRLNQARVDAVLGPGYKAGSAAANTALRDYYKANPPMSDAQRQALGQEIFNRTMARHREQGDGVATVRPAGSDNSTETVPEDKNALTRLMKLSGQR